MDRDDDGGDVEVDKVYDQQGDAGEAWNPPLVPPSNVEQIVADPKQRNGLERYDGTQIGSKLVVWEAVEEAAVVDMFLLQNNIAITAARRGGDDVLVEGERNEYDDGKEVDSGADGPHTLGDLDAR